MILQYVKNIYTKRFLDTSKVNSCMYVLGDVSTLTSRRPDSSMLLSGRQYTDVSSSMTEEVSGGHARSDEVRY